MGQHDENNDRDGYGRRSSDWSTHQLYVMNTLEACAATMNQLSGKLESLILQLTAQSAAVSQMQTVVSDHSNRIKAVERQQERSAATDHTESALRKQRDRWMGAVIGISASGVAMVAKPLLDKVLS